MFPKKTVHEKRWENVPRSSLFCCYNRWLGPVAPEAHVGPRKWKPLSLSHLSQEGGVYGDRKTPTAGNFPNQKPVPPAAGERSRGSPLLDPRPLSPACLPRWAFPSNQQTPLGAARTKHWASCGDKRSENTPPPMVQSLKSRCWV